MAHTFSMVLPTQDKHGKAEYVTQPPVFVGAADPVPLSANQIAIYTHLSASDVHRKMEIVNAWKMLYRGVRDRALLANDWNGVRIYSAVDVDSVTENNRKTASDMFVVQNGRVAIGIAGEVTASYLMGRGARDATNILEAYFERLIQFAREHTAFRQ